LEQAGKANEIVRTDDLIKHLPGQHDQKTHAGPRASFETVGEIIFPRETKIKINNITGQGDDMVIRGEIVE